MSDPTLGASRHPNPEAVILNAERASRCFILNHDAQTEEIARLRADNARMRVLLTRILDIPRKPASSEEEGQLGRAYTRGWQSVIDAIDTALLTEGQTDNA